MTVNLQLPDEPEVYGPVVDGTFRMRWMPGAFGDRTSLVDVSAYQIVDETWREGEDGIYLRDITRARVLSR